MRLAISKEASGPRITVVVDVDQRNAYGHPIIVAEVHDPNILRLLLAGQAMVAALEQALDAVTLPMRDYAAKHGLRVDGCVLLEDTLADAIRDALSAATGKAVQA